MSPSAPIVGRVRCRRKADAAALPERSPPHGRDRGHDADKPASLAPQPPDQLLELTREYVDRASAKIGAFGRDVQFGVLNPLLQPRTQPGAVCGYGDDGGPHRKSTWGQIRVSAQKRLTQGFAPASFTLQSLSCSHVRIPCRKDATSPSALLSSPSSRRPPGYHRVPRALCHTRNPWLPRVHRP